MAYVSNLLSELIDKLKEIYNPSHQNAKVAPPIATEQKVVPPPVVKSRGHHCNIS